MADLQALGEERARRRAQQEAEERKNGGGASANQDEERQGLLGGLFNGNRDRAQERQNVYGPKARQESFIDAM